MSRLRQFTLSIPCVLALATNGTAVAGETPLGGFAVRLGTGSLDNQCMAVSFAPLPVPVSFPGATSEIMYRVEALRGGNVDDVSGNVSIACGAGAVTQRRCEKWDVVAGEALLTSFTVAVSCGEPDKPPSPFMAGNYKLEVSKGGVSVETLDFTVEK